VDPSTVRNRFRRTGVPLRARPGGGTHPDREHSAGGVREVTIREDRAWPA
jgi:hypothetical protein